VVTAPSEAESPSRPLLILYFDFLQLQAEGRGRAAAAARKLVESSLRPGQRVFVVASTPRGLVELTPVTSDTAVILSALVAHTGWHWMVERGGKLSQFDWPELDGPFLASAMRWLMLLVASRALLAHRRLPQPERATRQTPSP
jgi:hypothetical protein